MSWRVCATSAECCWATVVFRFCTTLCCCLLVWGSVIFGKEERGELVWPKGGAACEEAPAFPFKLPFDCKCDSTWSFRYVQTAQLRPPCVRVPELCWWHRSWDWWERWCSGEAFFDERLLWDLKRFGFLKDASLGLFCMFEPGSIPSEPLPATENFLTWLWAWVRLLPVGFRRRPLSFLPEWVSMDAASSKILWYDWCARNCSASFASNLWI